MFTGQMWVILHLGKFLSQPLSIKETHKLHAPSRFSPGFETMELGNALIGAQQGLSLKGDVSIAQTSHSNCISVSESFVKKKLV